MAGAGARWGAAYAPPVYRLFTFAKAYDLRIGAPEISIIDFLNA